MKVQPLAPEDIDVPPAWVLQMYLSFSGRLASTGENEVDLQAIRQATTSDTAAKQMAHQWVKHGLAVRFGHGRYALVNPSVAARAWAMPKYYADLLRITDALQASDIPHAFACLTAAQESDYVPERPLLVAPPEADAIERLEHFEFGLPMRRIKKVPMDVMGGRFMVPTLPKDQAALILASTGLPREVAAAKDLLPGLNVTKRLARNLNALGLRTRPDVHESENPGIRLPPSIEEQRRRVADEVLREGLR